MNFKCVAILGLIFLFCACQHEYVRPDNYQNPQVAIQTDLGTITVELYEDKAPNTVSNFILLTESGFYDGMLFHFIVPGAILQGGCPNTKVDAQGQPGLGGPGYFIEDEIVEDLKHSKRGVLTMAKAMAKNSSGSQFAILFDKIPVLDDKQTVFGKVIKGHEVLELIEQYGDRNGKPKREIAFQLKILRKNDIEYKINKIEE
jgi:peptidyl-prolyl cis-trans isomerase B (cyclophilin B)